jgi:hypothetical protein
VPKQYRRSWLRWIDGAKTRDIPDAHYRWIHRARQDPEWRKRIEDAVRAIAPKPEEGWPHWNNTAVSQCNVSTICRSVRMVAYDIGFVKCRSGPGFMRDDNPALPKDVPLRDLWLTKPRKKLSGREPSECLGFRANFQGKFLDKQIREAQAALSAQIRSVASIKRGNITAGGTEIVLSGGPKPRLRAFIGETAWCVWRAGIQKKFPLANPNLFSRATIARSTYGASRAAQCAAWRRHQQDPRAKKPSGKSQRSECRHG